MNFEAVVARTLVRFEQGEFTTGRSRGCARPRIAAVGTVASAALTSPLLRSRLAAVGVEPTGYVAFDGPRALQASSDWELALVLSPYKRVAPSWCDRLAPTARASGVVDTLLCDGRSTLGINTNAYAAATAIDALLGGAELARLLVLGSGAGARSVAVGVRRLHPDAQIVITGRSAERAKALVDEIGFGSIATADMLNGVTDYDLIVNATTVGETDDHAHIELDVDALLRPGVRYFDLNNRLSALQMQAMRAGCVAASGIMMQIVTNAIRARLLQV